MTLSRSTHGSDLGEQTCSLQAFADKSSLDWLATLNVNPQRGNYNPLG